MESSHRVIVIGAGAAGLEAARFLTRGGVRVSLLEARGRIGGRILTLHDPDQPAPIELGAEFVHGRRPETWEIIRRERLATYDVSENEEFPQAASNAAAISHGFQDVLRQLQSSGAEDQSFAQFLDSHAAYAPADVKAAVTAYIEGFYAADQHLVSTHWLRDTEREVGPSTNRSFRIHSGHDRLSEALLAGGDQRLLDLRLSCPVTRVRWQAGRVAVEFRSLDGDQSLTADRAVIAVPLGVLLAEPGQVGAIDFEPALTMKRPALKSLRMGPVIKIVLAFREPFWEERHESVAFFHVPHEPFATWWTMRPLRASLLVGWSGGSRAQQLAGLANLELLDAALDSASTALDVDRATLSTLLVSSHTHDWSGDPYCRGAYSYAVVRGADAPNQLAAPVASTLFFAGEATHATLGGTVAGAIASGRRAAEELLASLPK